MKQLAMFAVSLVACSRAAPARLEVPPASLDELSLFDHHAHVYDSAVRHWVETELDLPPLPSFDANELLTLMTQDRVAKAAVLSNAYFFANGTEKQPVSPQLFAAENDHVADI